MSDGRAGNAAQVRAIVSAIGARARWMQIAHIQAEGHRGDPLVLSPRAPWTWLPVDAWPTPKLALPAAQRQTLSAPWPTIWIAAGRRSAPYSAAVRKWSGGKTFVVHILDPNIDPATFDLLVTPAHDGVSGENVISTVGSPTYFSPDDVEEAGLAFADLADEQERSAVVILGGTSKTHTFNAGAAETLKSQLKRLAGQGWRLRITTSRRTPVGIVAQMRALADEIGGLFWAGPEDGPNPYLAWLNFSDAAIVTEDSANMLSDAAYHGLPTHMARLHGRSDKFDRLHQSLVDHGCARWFDGELETWSYEPLREADRVADTILAALVARHPQPELSDATVVAPDWL